MYERRTILMILFFLFLGSSSLDARRVKRVPSANKVWSDALKANDSTNFHTTTKRKRYRSKRRKHKKRYRAKRKSKTTQRSVESPSKIIALSDEKKLQKSLIVLGFYHGAIDGEVNAFETREAIKAMNQNYRGEETTFLDSQMKNTLINLADLYRFDAYLRSEKSDEETRNLKLQTALKVFGFYTDEIDGLVGSGTRNSVAEYRRENDLGQGDRLDFEERYQLVSRAIASNNESIKEAKTQLKRRAESEGKSSVAKDVYQARPTETKVVEVQAIEERVPTEKLVDKSTPANEEFFSDIERITPAVKSEEPTSADLSPVEGSGITREECLVLVDSYDEALLEDEKDRLSDIKSTAAILLNMCSIKKTKSGDIAETLKRLETLSD